MIITQMGIQPNNTMGLLIIYIIYTSLSNSNLIQNFLLHFPIQNFWQFFFSLPPFFFSTYPSFFPYFQLSQPNVFCTQKKKPPHYGHHHHLILWLFWSFTWLVANKIKSTKRMSAVNTCLLTSISKNKLICLPIEYYWLYDKMYCTSYCLSVVDIIFWLLFSKCQSGGNGNSTEFLFLN